MSEPQISVNYRTATSTAVVSTPSTLPTMEATDVEIGQSWESVDIGPVDGDRLYLRLRSPDLVATIDQLRDLLMVVEERVLDARQDKMDAERHVCPGCPTRLEPDEVTCGAPRCNRELAMDGAF